MTKGNHSEFPLAYRKHFNPGPDATFTSRHLLKQSVLVDSENGVRASVITGKTQIVPDSVNTLADILEHGLSISRFLPCLGTRTGTDEPYSWMVYKELDDCVRAFGSALLDVIGTEAESRRFVGIYSRNSPAWVVTMHACAAYSFVYVPLYNTLGMEAMQHIMNQTKLQVILCHTASEASVAVKNFGSTLKCVIITSESDESKLLQNEYADKLRIFHFDEFIAYGDQRLQLKQLPKPDEMCTLCYTSGSTGIPKGVVLQHRQIVDSIRSCICTFEGKYSSSAVVHMSYLPLAHIMEQLLTNYILLLGAREGFLTGGPETLLADIGALRPTMLVAVPRVLSKLRTEYYKKVPKSSFMRNKLQKLIVKKSNEQANGKYDHHSLWDNLFFRKFRRALGDRVSGILSGGAPLDHEVGTFIKAALSCPIMEGYGSTETSGLLTCLLIGETEKSVAGAITPNVEVKLADVPEMGIIFSRDNVGEICARGLRCTKGYYEDPENTAKLLDADGWLHTGDVGQWTQNGGLKLVDRCKNMFKLTQGEYIAAEKVEGVYGCCSLVLFSLLDGSSTRTFAVVVIHPDLTALAEVAAQKGLMTNKRKLSTSGPENVRQNEQLCADLEVRKHVLTEINKLGRERGLKGFELAKNIHLTPEPFTIDNGLLTPTLKLSRYRARVVFKQVIQDLYAEGELIS